MTRALLNQAEEMAKTIRQQPPQDRLALRPEFSRLLSNLRIEGVSVPRHLQQLDTDLSEEEAETQFDNMPV
ncbi:hypothetical protein ACFP4H_02650 [Pseudophaeobacter arcticus]|uniref:hypothetical protein n=1 Tax=Pseudophaeobacter arcticus TaxID=385492 RepID=UPI000428E533|nr:hypothetical protein [Pseudophaeobacter arcticus]